MCEFGAGALGTFVISRSEVAIIGGFLFIAEYVMKSHLCHNPTL